MCPVQRAATQLRFYWPLGAKWMASSKTIKLGSCFSSRINSTQKHITHNTGGPHPLTHSHIVLPQGNFLTHLNNILVPQWYLSKIERRSRTCKVTGRWPLSCRHKQTIGAIVYLPDLIYVQRTHTNLYKVAVEILQRWAESIELSPSEPSDFYCPSLKLQILPASEALMN